MSIRVTFLPELDRARSALAQRAVQQAVTFELADFGGTRTLADTTQILNYRDAEYAKYAAAERQAGRTPIAKETWRPIAPYGSSYHNFGAAFDVGTMHVNGVPAPQGSALWTRGMSVLASIAPSVGLRWGGTFSAARKDPAHFELAIPISDAKARWTRFVQGENPTTDDNTDSETDDGTSDENDPSSAGAATGAGLALLLGVAGLAYVAVRASR